MSYPWINNYYCLFYAIINWEFELEIPSVVYNKSRVPLYSGEGGGGLIALNVAGAETHRIRLQIKPEITSFQLGPLE